MKGGDKWTSPVAGEHPIYTLGDSSSKHPNRAFIIGGANTSQGQANAGVGVSRQDEPTRVVNTMAVGSWKSWLESGKVVSMTVRALARFQTFPDWYKFPKLTKPNRKRVIAINEKLEGASLTDWQRELLIEQRDTDNSLSGMIVGNAVPCLMYRVIAESLKS